jgi:rhamnulokinase
MLPDYLNFLLTGVKKQEHTNATTTALLNTETHNWNYEIIEKLGIDKSIFLPLAEPGEAVGYVLPEIEEEIGYKPLIVLPATHDTASAVLAVPDDGKNSLYLSSGTWSIMGVPVDKAIKETSLDGKSYSNEGGINNTFRFQTNIMGMWIFQNVKKELGDDSFAQLTKIASESTYNEIFDVNDKRFFAPKSMIGEITSYFEERNIIPPKTPADICYSIFNSLAECYKNTIKGISETTEKTFDKLHIIGGGSQNELLNKLTAKKANVTVVSGPTEATALGNIIVQLKAIGVIKTLEKGKKLIKKSFDIKEIKNV